MKKKKLTGKLSLEKSKISALNASKIRGGGTYLESNCYACVTFPNNGCNGTQDCPEGTDGSECKCL